MPKGVFTQGKNLYISFQWGGRRCKEVFAPNGISLPATAENARAAEGYRESILAAIAAEGMGGPKFRYEQWFPESLYWRRQKAKKESATMVGEAVSAWLAEQNIAPSNYRRMSAATEEFIERWGKVRLIDFRFAMLRDWIRASQKAGRSLKTIKNMIWPLRGAIREAIADEVIEIDPFAKLDWRNYRPTDTERARRKLSDQIDPFDLDEIAAILKHAREYENIIRFGFGCGARPNEIFGLGWEDVDVAGWTTAHVRFGLVRGRVSFLKTERSDRMLDLPRLPMALDALKRQRIATYMADPIDCGTVGSGARRIKIGSRRFVFLNPSCGRPWKGDDNFRKAWARILHRAGVRYRYPYQMRHTFVTLALAAGESPMWIAKMLGHTDATMVLTRYGRFFRQEYMAGLSAPGTKLANLLNSLNGTRKAG